MSNLKRIRETSGLSQSGLSKESGVNIQMIQHYEQGVRSINKAQAQTVHKLAKVLNCSMEELIENDE